YKTERPLGALLESFSENPARPDCNLRLFVLITVSLVSQLGPVDGSDALALVAGTLLGVRYGQHHDQHHSTQRRNHPRPTQSRKEEHCRQKRGVAECAACVVLREHKRGWYRPDPPRNEHSPQIERAFFDARQVIRQKEDREHLDRLRRLK